MSGLPDSKPARYASLVAKRKACRECPGLTNQSDCGIYDKHDEIGAWSRWQGNLDAELMVVGQDWGDVDCFIRTEGRPIYGTNMTLVDLLQCAGFSDIQPFDKTVRRGSLFFTNGILCLKQGGAQSAVKSQWFRQCGEHFLRPLIEIVQPKAVVCLGNRAYRGLLSAYGIKPRKLRDAVDSGEPEMLPKGIAVFVVYHCGKYVLNTHRCLARQKEDWSRIGERLKRRREGRNP
jgi:uracil-DNA glycosylase family 4